MMSRRTSSRSRIRADVHRINPLLPFENGIIWYHPVGTCSIPPMRPATPGSVHQNAIPPAILDDGSIGGASDRDRCPGRRNFRRGYRDGSGNCARGLLRRRRSVIRQLLSNARCVAGFRWMCGANDNKLLPYAYRYAAVWHRQLHHQHLSDRSHNLSRSENKIGESGGARSAGPTCTHRPYDDIGRAGCLDCS